MGCAFSDCANEETASTKTPETKSKQITRTTIPSPSLVMDVTQFVVSNKILGLGGFGIVQLIEKRSNSSCQYFAMKSLSKSNVVKRPNGIASVLTELKALILLENHPFICNVQCAFQNESFLYLIIDLVPGGDMRANIRKCENFRFPENVAKFYAIQLILAVSACHQFNILHRGEQP